MQFLQHVCAHKLFCLFKSASTDLPDQEDNSVPNLAYWYMMQGWKALVHAYKYQIHFSRSFDPFLNLSLEHYLLQNSPPHATVLFLYINRPCVVIGRNQNPWLEVDLNLLKNPRACDGTVKLDGKVSTLPWENVPLVRRRSGGGTVFHDEGNVNYCVICPTANFTRDKHAEMVTRAIRGSNLRARVNERHDIVLDQGGFVKEKDWPDMMDMHRTVFDPNCKEKPPLKVSGSAYKMTRQRCLHHGTCLLASGDLPGILRYLRSPSRPFIKARGVESVGSSIGNVYPTPKSSSQGYSKSFMTNVVEEFVHLYKIVTPDRLFQSMYSRLARDGDMKVDRNGEWIISRVGDDLNGINEIREGTEELQVSISNKDHTQGSAHAAWTQSSRWIYGQTPQFTLSSHSNEEDEKARPPLPTYFPPSVRT